jgi:hypothetical protein
MTSNPLGQAFKWQLMKLALFIIVLLVSCHIKTANKQIKTRDIHDFVEADNIHTIDTTIHLCEIVKSNFNGENLTDSLAKKTLYTYFGSKGYYNSDNLPDIDKLTETEAIKPRITFIEIIKIELNNNRKDDAIILYDFAPPLASGHCWLPHKAIILDTEKGYQITNVDFIPDNFVIDSVLNTNRDVTIYGYEYDCIQHKISKSIRARIK